MKITVPNIRQIQYEICWAACIEMVARYIIKPSSNKLITKTLAGSTAPVPLQYEILEEFLLIDTDLDTPTDNAPINSQELPLLQNFCAHQGGFPGMTYDSNRYQYILKKRFGINCVQIRESHFPAFTFLASIINKKQAVILGIRYPGSNKNHAIVVTGYVKNNHQRLLRVNDPFTDNGNELICKEKKGKEKYLSYDVLNELNRPPQLPTTIAHYQSINIIYNFWEDVEITALPYQSEITSPKVYGSVEEIAGIVKELFYLNKLFEIPFDNLKFSSNLIEYNTVTITQFIQIHENNSSNFFIPIIAHEEQLYEIIVSEGVSVNTSYYFIGVQESYFPKLNTIEEVWVKDFDGVITQVSIEHINPNYSILQILPINLFLMVLQGENFKCYVALIDIPYAGIKYLSAYSFEELTDALQSNYPAYLQ